MSRRYDTRVPRTPIHEYKDEQRTAWIIVAIVSVLFCAVVVLLKDVK